MDSQALVPAFESYAWHRIYPRLQGQPTLMPMDEFGMSIKHPTSLGYVERGLRLNRDKRGSFILATQDPMDVLKPDVGHMLEISCPTRIYMPNAAAADHGPVKAYEALGVSRPGIRELAGAIPKAQAYVQQRPLGEALIDVALTDLERTVCGHSSPEDHRKMDEMVRTYGVEDFAPAWLFYWGHEAEAQRVAQWNTEQRRSRGDPRLIAEVAKVFAGVE
jgi:type IV secretion system protein VirB4